MEAQISGGEDVGAAEIEHEEHFDGPCAYALDREKRCADLLVGHCVELFGGDLEGLKLMGDICDISGFLSGKSY